MQLGKKEAEISKWMRGTHNFTIDTLVSIEQALDAPILEVVHQEEVYAQSPQMADKNNSPFLKIKSKIPQGLDDLAEYFVIGERFSRELTRCVDFINSIDDLS